MQTPFRSGYVTLIGRPNVGKSTLLNAILGQKIAIVSQRRQTTRNRIVGIKHLPDAQLIFIDTPGIHIPVHALGEVMVSITRESLNDADVVVFVTDSSSIGEGDLAVIERLRGVSKPVFLALSKADKKSPDEIAHSTQAFSGLCQFAACYSVSGRTNLGLTMLLQDLVGYLPEGPRYYDEDTVTDQYERFLSAEIIREKILRNTTDEVPHAVAVDIVQWNEKHGLIRMDAVIYVERMGQKGIIIGSGGEMLKTIGIQARKDIEALISRRVYLALHVKVRKGWRNDRKILWDFGYR